MSNEFEIITNYCEAPQGYRNPRNPSLNDGKNENIHVFTTEKVTTTSSTSTSTTTTTTFTEPLITSEFFSKDKKKEFSLKKFEK